MYFCIYCLDLNAVHVYLFLCTLHFSKLDIFINIISLNIRHDSFTFLAYVCCCLYVCPHYIDLNILVKKCEHVLFIWQVLNCLWFFVSLKKWSINATERSVLKKKYRNLFYFPLTIPKKGKTSHRE